MLLLLACTSSSDKESTGEDLTPLVEPVVSAAARLHDTYGTVVYVTWTQAEETTTTHVEYSFDEGVWASTPTQVGTLGDHEQIVLGVPYGATLSWRVVASRGDDSVTVEGAAIDTEAVPEYLPAVTVDIAETSAWAAGDRFILTSVSEKFPGASQTPKFRVVLVDRQGRYVWAHDADPGSWTLFAKPSRDGTAILYDDSLFWTDMDGGDDGMVHRLHLDGSVEREWPTPGLHHAFDDLAADTIVWDTLSRNYDVLMLSEGDAEAVGIWRCQDWLDTVDLTGNTGGGGGGGAGGCGANGMNWNEDTDTFSMSLWSHEAILELDHASGEVLWYAAPQQDAGYSSDTVWYWQHEPTMPAPDRVLLSSGFYDQGGGGGGGGGGRDQFDGTAAYEFAIDREAGTLELVWSYRSEPEWASSFKGGARRLANGNTLHYYGSFAGIKEITPGGDVVWQVRFTHDEQVWVGRSHFLDDLYAFAP